MARTIGILAVVDRVRCSCYSPLILIATDHPGPFNAADPTFSQRNDDGLKLALKRARAVRDFAGYYWTLRGYVAGFDDGHIQFLTLNGSPLLTAEWPGFLTGLDAAGRLVVMTRADDEPIAAGSRLVSCDGVDADDLFARNVGAFAGRWSLGAARPSCRAPFSSTARIPLSGVRSAAVS